MSEVTISTFYELTQLPSELVHLAYNICKSGLLDSYEVLYEIIDIINWRYEEIDDTLKDFTYTCEDLHLFKIITDKEAKEEIANICNVSEILECSGIYSSSEINDIVETINCLLYNEEAIELFGITEEDRKNLENDLIRMENYYERISTLEDLEGIALLEHLISLYNENICIFIKDYLNRHLVEDYVAEVLYQLWEKGYKKEVKNILLDNLGYLPDELKEGKENE